MGPSSTMISTIRVDGFPLAEDRPTFNRHPEDGFDNDADAQSVDEAYSIASTALATEVGSVVGAPKDAFLRSVTFHKNCLPPGMDWGLELLDPTPAAASGRRSRGTFSRDRQKLVIGSIEGAVALSTIQPGDVLHSINGKRMGPSYTAERAMAYMHTCFDKDEYLSIAVGNETGSDVLVQATIVKPRPDMTYEDLGMVVWVWGVLCIKSIDKSSPFRNTVLKSTDHLVSINDIELADVSPEGFAHILNGLPQEITIVVRRGKQRWTGRFG